jgi:hypothetical protein
VLELPGALLQALGQEEQQGVIWGYATGASFYNHKLVPQTSHKRNEVGLFMA